MSQCKSCGAEIKWIKTLAGKNHPIDAKPEKRWVYTYPEDPKQAAGWSLEETHTSHFATCPDGKQWSGKGRTDFSTERFS